MPEPHDINEASQGTQTSNQRGRGVTAHDSWLIAPSSRDHLPAPHRVRAIGVIVTVLVTHEGALQDRLYKDKSCAKVSHHKSSCD